ncbi:alpha/beta-hydrolase [Xylariaceae sp. FL1019]|nr:alpha/beta-hydrolase [Xylariaceae sp. FL1019]
MKTTALLALSASLAQASELNFDFPYNTTAPVPYEISVNPGIIEEARLKASLYRPSIDLRDGNVANAGWVEGPPRENMTALAKYWAEEYDWNKAQKEINGNFSHFAITLASGSAGDYKHPVPLHFIHERSDSPDALPIILLHGWPSTSREWFEVIEPLRDSSTQPFHVVAPDLPGFGFSPAATYSGMNAPQIADAMNSLMISLGYDKYGIACTDVGWFVGLFMGSRSSDNVIGLFSDFWLISPNATDLERRANNQTTEEETLYLDAIEDFENNHFSYATAHEQTPLAIAQAMTDTPVGFAGWVWHLVIWANDGYQYTFDELITNTLALWIQGTYGNVYSYKEALPYASDFTYVTVPTGASVWGNTNSPLTSIGYAQLTPRSWIERMGNLTFYSKHEHGGHFPAMYEPELWTADVVEFFKSLVN